MMRALTISQVARRFGVTTRTIENRIRAQCFAPHDYRAGHKGWRFWYLDTVEKYLGMNKTMKKNEKE